MQFGVIGLGLMGSSLLLAARQKRLFDRFVGFDALPNHAKYALDHGIIDEVSDCETLLKSCDLIALAVPVEAIAQLLPSLAAASESAIFFDLGSTKTAIVSAIPALIRPRFVAAHPMAGTEYSGPSAGFASLYNDRVAVLCDTEENSAEALAMVSGVFEAIGMRIVKMGAKEHDRHAAFISHLPHMISYALANTVLSQEDKANILTLAAGGFRDMSRLAKSSSKMWIDIFKQNKPAVLDSLEVFRRELDAAQEWLQNDRFDELAAWMKSANTLHEIFTPLGSGK
ncbi:prephenate dehydrogenase [Campylobacterota bacterium]|nr:prephenate dehydrogenase [Campylobacterota bacterium]